MPSQQALSSPSTWGIAAMFIFVVVFAFVAILMTVYHYRTKNPKPLPSWFYVFIGVPALVGALCLFGLSDTAKSVIAAGADLVSTNLKK